MLKSYSENFTQGFSVNMVNYLLALLENHGATIRSNTTTRFAVWIVFVLLFLGFSILKYFIVLFFGQLLSPI
jgi:membrane-associated protease RseP (regulator of RpoE activity)